MCSTARCAMCHTSPPSASGEECYFAKNPLNSGCSRSKERKRKSGDFWPGEVGGNIRIRPENSAGDAGKVKRASKAFSTRLSAKNQTRPLMGMDWKILRGWKGAIKSPWALRADDGRSCLGETPGVPEPDQRDCRISADVTDRL